MALTTCIFGLTWPKPTQAAIAEMTNKGVPMTSVQDHARGAIGRGEECGNDLEALKGAGLLLSLAVLHDVAELLRFGFQVKGFKATLKVLYDSQNFSLLAV